LFPDLPVEGQRLPEVVDSLRVAALMGKDDSKVRLHLREALAVCDIPGGDQAVLGHGHGIKVVARAIQVAEQDER